MNAKQREFVLAHTQVLVLVAFRIAHNATMQRLKTSRLSEEYPAARERQDQAWGIYDEAKRTLKAREEEWDLLLTETRMAN